MEDELKLKTFIIKECTSLTTCVVIFGLGYKYNFGYFTVTKEAYKHAWACFHFKTNSIATCSTLILEIYTLKCKLNSVPRYPQKKR